MQHTDRVLTEFAKTHSITPVGIPGHYEVRATELDNKGYLETLKAIEILDKHRLVNHTYAMGTFYAYVYKTQ